MLSGVCSMLTELLLPLPKTGKNPPLQLILMGWQAEQEQGHRGQFVVDQTAIIILLPKQTLLNLTSIHNTLKC